MSKASTAKNNFLNTRFPKSERVHREDTIQILLKQESIACFPLRFTWLKRDSKRTEILIVVSKKKIPKAVDRNTLKRRIRATFRKYKHHFLGYTLMASYTSQEISTSDEIIQAWEALLKRIIP